MKETNIWRALAAALMLCCGCGSSIETTAAGSGGGAGVGGSGAGGAGGCSATTPCEGGSFCVYEVGECGPDVTGVCQSGFTCDGPPTGPVCLCDGTVVEGANAICDVWPTNSQIADPALCATGTFACGTLQCQRHAEYCLEILPGVPGPTSYSCKAAGGTCSGIADCSCITEAEGPGDVVTCSANADMQETVTIASP